MKHTRATLVFFLYSLTLAAQDSLFREAGQLYQQAAYARAYESFRSAGLNYQLDNDFAHYSLCNLWMARCLTRTAAFQSSIELVQNTNDYIQEVLDDNPYLHALALSILGDNYLNLGQNDRAITYIQEAEKHFPAEFEADRADIYNALGVIYGNNGNRELALQYHFQALEMRRRLFFENSLPVADSYNNIGLIYMQTDGLQAGIYFSRAYKAYERELGTLHPKTAYARINLARARALQENYTEAFDIIQQVQMVWDTLYARNDHPNRAFTLATLGQLYEGQGNLPRSLHFQQLALQQYLRIFGAKHPEVANIHFLIGSTYQKMEKYKEALYSYQQAVYANLPGQAFELSYDLPVLTNYFHPDYLLTALLAKAKVLEALHFEKTLKKRDLDAALSTYQLADSLVTDIRKIREDERDKIRLGETARLIYENGIRLSMVLSELPFQRRQYQSIAYQFMERSKSAVLLEAIQETNAKSFAGIPDKWIVMEDSLKSVIALYQQQIASGMDLTANQHLLFEAKAVYRSFVTRLEQEYPAYYNLKYKSQTASLPQLQAALAPSEAVVMYFNGSDQRYRLLVTAAGFRMEPFDLSDKASRLVTAMRNAIRFQIGTALTRHATELYSLLVPTVPSGIHSLILMPDGVFNTLPFEALINPNTGKYLIEDFSVSYDYSSSLYLDRINRTIPDIQRDILLMAPIHFDGTSLPSLPATAKEVREISRLFVSAHAQASPFINGQASEEWIKTQDLRTFRYIHLATHGVVNESSPEWSRIYLQPSPAEDGQLLSGDIYNLSVQADLIALSACETGLGKLEKGEGILGLSRALLYAGANNLLVSLWPVSDTSTSQLMIEFYRHHLFIQSPDSYGSSLRQAKLALLQSETFHAPYFWASFIIVGH